MHHILIGRARTRSLVLALGGSLAGALLAGCGHAAPSSASTQQARLSSALQFAQCMRSHGENVPDPSSSGSGVQIHISAGAGINPNSAQFQQAQSACKKYLPSTTLTPQQQEQAQQNALEYAQCMQNHGVNVPDPQVTSNGVSFSLGSISPNDPAFQSAQQACSSKLGNVPVMIRGGSGPAPAGGPGPSGQGFGESINSAVGG